MSKIILVLFFALIPFLSNSLAYAMGGAIPALPAFSPPLPPPPPLTVKCGDVITASATISNDLKCSTAGYALLVEGDNIIVNGNGHSITAPNAAAGLFIAGSSINVSGFIINGVTGGNGIFAYDSPNVVITNNDVSNNLVGIMLYAESKVVSGVSVTLNRAKNSSLFGIRMSQDGAGSFVNPVISSNDFSNSGSYAIHLGATSLTLDGSNVLNNSINGIYLYGGSFTLSNITLGAQSIPKTQIFIDSASNLVMNNVDVSTQLPAQASQERIGLEMYRVANFNINSFTARNNDIGIRMETDRKVSGTGTIQNSLFAGQSIAAVIITSYDSTAFGTIYNSYNSFLETLPAQSVIVGAGTVASLITVVAAPVVPVPDHKPNVVSPIVSIPFSPFVLAAPVQPAPTVTTPVKKAGAAVAPPVSAPVSPAVGGGQGKMKTQIQ